MRRRQIEALVTRHRPPKGDAAQLQAQVRSLTARIEAARGDGTITNMRAAGSVSAARVVLDAALEAAAAI
jgi:hypothetical protein